MILFWRDTARLRCVLFDFPALTLFFTLGLSDLALATKGFDVVVLVFFSAISYPVHHVAELGTGTPEVTPPGTALD